METGTRFRGCGWLIGLALMALAWLLTGCQTHLTGGTPIRPEIMTSLSLGLPYQEVVAEFGLPWIFVDGERAIAYPWDTNRGYFDVHPSWDPGSDLYSKEVHPVYHALCFKFDDQKKLQAWTHIKAPTFETRRQQMKDWAAGQPVTTPARDEIDLQANRHTDTRPYK